MLINVSAFNEDYALENDLTINEVVFIGYISYLSKRNVEEFMYSYAKIFEGLPIIFNCKTENAKYKKIKKILDTDRVMNFIQRTNKRNGSKGIEVTFKLNLDKINKLQTENMFTEE